MPLDTEIISILDDKNAGLIIIHVGNAQHSRAGSFHTPWVE